MIEPKILKGFRDSLPEQEIARQELISKVQKIFRSFGFMPIDTPALEYTEVLLGKGGGETDKQMFRFMDNGNRDVALRFDLTVPLARFVAANYSNLAFPFKRYHIAKVWRGEKPQKGRYREFIQCDFDIVGADNAQSDFEILLLIHTCLTQMGVGPFKVSVSHRGLLNRFLATMGLESSSVEVLRAIDKLGKIGKDGVCACLKEDGLNDQAIAKLLDYISLEKVSFGKTLDILKEMFGTCPEIERLEEIYALMKACDIEKDFILDTSITRGLDYYTGIVYETVLVNLPSIGSICSGGRYNNLAGLYTKENLPGVGSCIGIDRLLAALEELGKPVAEDQSYVDLLVAYDSKNPTWTQKTAMDFRAQGKNVACYVGDKSIGQQCAYAEKCGIPTVVLSGDDNMYKLKDIRTREVYTLPRLIQLNEEKCKMTNPKTLPVYLHRQDILDALSSHQVIVVESPTGSGKTTQIPLILNEAGYAKEGVIGITQPRRIATLGVCSYIKQQLASSGLSDAYCGYKMRFYDTTDATTRIKILTDGMLLQELKADPSLLKYSVIMVDEAHERSLNIDLILGLLKQIIAHRKDLKIIISSATINTTSFANFFCDENGVPAPIISIKARVYEVAVKYYPLKNPENVDETALAICQILNQLLKRFKSTDYKQNEDTLVFLPGEFSIITCMTQIYTQCDTRHLQIYPLYGRLNKEEQELVFEDTEEGKMKVVLATNIAETSLTIDGIKVVIDGGYAKINFYNQRDFTSALIQRPISKASAEQRKGRAGRTSNGICYKLYSKEDFAKRPRYTQEEILRTDLSEVVLRMVDLGIYDFETFPFITRPDTEALRSGENTLKLLGAIDNNRNLTPIGEIMVKYPLLPRHSRCVYEAIKRYPDIILPVLICVSFLSCKTPFILPPGEEDLARSAHKSFFDEYGDFVSYQKLYKKYNALKTTKQKEDFCKTYYLDLQSMDEIVHVTEQLTNITRDLGVPVLDEESNSLSKLPREEFVHKLLVCLGAGLLQYVCVKTKARGMEYRTITTTEIYIHPGSAWFRTAPQYLLAGEIVYTSRMYARTVSPLKREWLDEISPSLASRIRNLSKEEKTGNKGVSKAVGEKKPKQVCIYDMVFDLVSAGGKKDKQVAVIPYTSLPKLAYAFKKASRHPKNIDATIEYNGRYICFGTKLQDLIRLNGRISFKEDGFVQRPCNEIFDIKIIDNLVPYLDQLMKLTPMRVKNRLGFIELLLNRNSAFFHVNASFTEALNNSTYSLLVISDERPDIKAFLKTYNRLLRLLD